MVKAVVFDWGGTLTRFHSVDLLESWRAAAAELAPDRQDEVARALREAEDEVWSRTTTTMRAATTAQVLRAACEAVGLPIDELLHDRATATYLAHWTPFVTTQSRPDAKRTLTALKERGLATGLLSNTHWPRAQHEQWLARDGLEQLLDSRHYTSDMTYVKPHPSAFQAVLDALGVDAHDTVFVGDRLWDDVAGAQRLGMRTIWIRNDEVPYYDVTPDASVTGLDEIVAIVDDWMAQAG